MRKLHSLSGVIPVGVFLIEHLITNSMALQGADQYNKSVSFITSLPYLLFLEIFGIFIPLAFHAIYGIKIAMTAQPNSGQYPYMANKRYTWQRVTGYIAFVFIIVHLAKFRFAHWIWPTMADGKPRPHFLESGNFFQTTYDGLMNWQPWGIPVAPWLVLGFYTLGLAAACFHFANGLWTFCISWGITVGAKAQQRFGYVAAVVGISLFGLGAMSLYGFANPKEAKKAATQTNASAVVDGDRSK